MDPNAQNPQGESDAVKKLEKDLQSLSQQPAAEQPVPTSLPIQPYPPVPEVSSVVPAPSTPPVMPIETIVSAQEGPKKGSPLMIIAIILAVVAVLAVVAYVFGAKLFSAKPTPTPIVVAVPTPISDPTANWKTYTSSDGKFLFKYPDDNDWKLNIYQSPLAASAGVICQTCMGQNIESFGVVPVIFKTLAEFSNSDTTSNLADKTNIKLGSLDAIRSIQLGSPQAPTCRIMFIPFKNQGYELIECFKDTRTSSITKSSVLPLANPDILSTFKFIESTPSGSPVASPTLTPTASPTSSPSSSPSATVTP